MDLSRLYNSLILWISFLSSVIFPFYIILYDSLCLKILGVLLNVLKSKSGRLYYKNNVPTSSPATTLLTLFKLLLFTITISAPASVTILAFLRSLSPFHSSNFRYSSFCHFQSFHLKLVLRNQFGRWILVWIIRIKSVNICQEDQ